MAGPARHLTASLLAATVLSACGANSASAAQAPRLTAVAARATQPSSFGAQLASPALAAGCSLPVTYDPYQGFRVGVPSGWDVLTMGNTIVVSKGSSDAEAAVLFPAALTNSMTPAGFFNSYLHYEQHRLASEGDSLAFKMQASSNDLPLASLQIRTSTALLMGFARVFLLPLRTQFSSREVVFSSWWAPPSRWAADSADLMNISHCYSTAPAQLFGVFRDQSFTYVMPPGWSVLDEGQDNVDLRGDNNNADVSYLFFGIPPQYNTPQLALDHIFQVERTTVTAVLSRVRLPDQQLPAGGVEGQEYEEYLGNFQGKTVHGLVYVLTDSGGSAGTYGVLRLGAATTNLWNAVNGGLIEMMGAVQHSFVQDLEQIQRLDQQWQAESAEEANFDDIINGYQLAQDPNTGQPYLAPYDSFGDGPEGSGYYGPNGQLLVPISH